MKTTLKKFIKDINKLNDCIQEQKGIVMLTAIEETKVNFLKRIFTFGFDSNGELFGSYSKSYLLRRLNKGFNNLNKNLYFGGNLFRSIITNVDGNNAQLGFSDQDQADIANYQETSEIQINRPIFKLTKEETNVFFDSVTKQINNIIKNCLR